MLGINEARYVGSYNIQLSFNNGKEGIADLKETIFNDKRPIFSKLKSQADFSNFTVNHSTVVWPNGLDMAPEYLFYLAFKESTDADCQSQFRCWGYIT